MVRNRLPHSANITKKSYYRGFWITPRSTVIPEGLVNAEKRWKARGARGRWGSMGDDGGRRGWQVEWKEGREGKRRKKMAREGEERK